MNLDQMMNAIAKAERAGDAEAAEWMKAEATKRLTGEGDAMTNLGAGFTKALQGARQLIPGMEGPSDEEIRETRRTSEMAAGDSWANKGAQLAGEIAPALAIPGGAGARLLARAVGATPARIGVQRAIAGAALEGAGAASLAPVTSDESRAGNMALGAGFGAALPPLAKAAGAAARLPARVAERVQVALPERLGGRQAHARFAGRELDETLQREILGDEALARMSPTDRVAAIQARFAEPSYVPADRGAQTFRPTSAAAYGSRELAGLEKAARTADAPQWAERDAAEAAKRWQLLEGNLQDAGDIAAREAERQGVGAGIETMRTATARMREEIPRLAQALDSAKRSPEFITQAPVRAAVAEVERVLGSGVEPNVQILHGARKALAQGLNIGQYGVPGARAATSTPAIRSLVDELDTIIANTVRRGPGRTAGLDDPYTMWQRDYAKASEAQTVAEAEQKLRGAFVDEMGQARNAAGEVRLTPHALKRAVAQARKRGAGPKRGREVPLSPQAEQAIGEVMQDLNKAGILDEVRKAATLGGSDTAYNLTQAGVVGVLGNMIGDSLLPGGAFALRALGRANIARAKQRILTEILDDPQNLQRFIQAAAERAQQEAGRAGVSGLVPYGALAGGVAAQPNQ